MHRNVRREAITLYANLRIKMTVTARKRSALRLIRYQKRNEENDGKMMKPGYRIFRSW